MYLVLFFPADGKRNDCSTESRRLDLAGVTAGTAAVLSIVSLIYKRRRLNGKFKLVKRIFHSELKNVII